MHLLGAAECIVASCVFCKVLYYYQWYIIPVYCFKTVYFTNAETRFGKLRYLDNLV
jgi:hypothetical protein